MQVTVKTQLLRRELEFVGNACRSYLPMVGKFTIEGKTMSIECSNVNTSARTLVPLLKADDNFQFSLKLDKLSAILTKVKASTVQLEHSDKKVVLTFGKSNYVFETATPNEYIPALPPTMKVASSDLKSVINALQPFYTAFIHDFTQATNKFALRGIAIEIADNLIRGWWASLYQAVLVTAKASATGVGILFIPRESINTVLALSPLPDDTFGIATTAERVFFSRFPREVSYQVDKKVVPIDACFPADTIQRATIHDIEEFNNAITAAKAFTKKCVLPFISISTSENAITVSATVRYDEDGNTFTVSDTTDEDEYFEYEVDATVTHSYEFKASVSQLLPLATSGQLHIHSSAKGTVLVAGNVTSHILNMKH